MSGSLAANSVGALCIEKIVPINELISIFELPSSGSNETMNLPCSSPATDVYSSSEDMALTKPDSNKISLNNSLATTSSFF